METAIKKYENHPSIIATTEKFCFTVRFEIEEVNLKDIEKEIWSLNTKKAVTSNSIPAKVLKETSDICSPVIKQIWSDKIFKKRHFPEDFKLVDIIYVFKKEDRNLAKNYRRVRDLPILSKVFKNISCPHICVVTKKGSVPNTLFWHHYKNGKKKINKKGFAGGILMDLSKVFDTLNHELLIAKRLAYGFGKESLMLILSYL